MSATSKRVVFVDLARAAAVLFMIQGHALQVLLGPDYQHGVVFDVWLYLRGLTSCAFLLLAGFSFSLATLSHWDQYQAVTARTRRRLARFAMFLLLGYGMHIPIRPLSDIGHLMPEQWQAFAMVDILQLVAVTLAALQALVWLTRTPRRFGSCVLVAGVAIVLLTPLMWRVNWNRVLPALLASYLSGDTGSLFPLFPWAAYALFGAALGVRFATVGEEAAGNDPARAFLVLGTIMLASGVLLHAIPFSPYGPIEFWRTSPNLFLVKAGSVLVLMSLAARIGRARTGLPGPVTALSRESLTVYFVHVCILYGSIWNTGLLQAIGPRLDPATTALWIAGLAVSMTVVAWGWQECKRRGEMSAAFIRATVAAALLYSLA